MSDGKTKGGTTASRAGALQSSVNILLHTHYAIRLWEGRKRDAPDDTGVKKKRPEIISMPQAIARAGNTQRGNALGSLISRSVKCQRFQPFTVRIPVRMASGWI